MRCIETGVKEIGHQLDHGIPHGIGGGRLHPVFQLVEHQPRIRICTRTAQCADADGVGHSPVVRIGQKSRQLVDCLPHRAAYLAKQDCVQHVLFEVLVGKVCEKPVHHGPVADTQVFRNRAQHRNANADHRVWADVWDEFRVEGLVLRIGERLQTGADDGRCRHIRFNSHAPMPRLRAHHLEHAGAVPFVGAYLESVPLVESNGALRGDELKTDRPAGGDRLLNITFQLGEQCMPHAL